MRVDPETCRDPELLAAEVQRLREAIRRLAEQDATLSVCEGNVTVTMDGPLAWIGVFDGEPDPEFLWSDKSAARRWISGRPGVELAPLVLGAFDRSQPIATPEQDNTPPPHSNQSEVSVRPECAVSPPWMARQFWVDPPSGHRYGFPKLYDRAFDGDITAWMVRNGYPERLARQNLPCTFTAAIDSQ